MNANFCAAPPGSIEVTTCWSRDGNAATFTSGSFTGTPPAGVVAAYTGLKLAMSAELSCSMTASWATRFGPGAVNGNTVRGSMGWLGVT